MTKRQIYYLFLTILLFGAAIGFDLISKQFSTPKNYLTSIELHLQKKEAQAEKILADKNYIFQQVERFYQKDNVNSIEEFKTLKELNKQDFTLSIYQNDTLVFWSKNTAIPTRKDLFNRDTTLHTYFSKQANGYYALTKQNYFHPEYGHIIASALIPIKYEYALKSDHLKNHFTADNKIPEEVEITDIKTNFPIKSKYGNTICYIKANKNYNDKSNLKVSLFIYLLAFISLFILINSLALSIARNKRSWMGAAFLIVVVFSIRGISMALNFTGIYEDLALFNREFKPLVFSESLGDLLINVLLLLWIIFFFQKEFRFSSFDHLSKSSKFFLTTLNSFAIILALIMVASTFKSLVLLSGIIFDFDNVFKMGRSSLLALSAVVLLLIALFLFSHRMAQTNMEIGLVKNTRLLALALATVFSIPVMIITDLRLPIPQLILFSIIFVILFDFFIDTRSANLTWLIIWLVVFAGFSSTLSFKYSNDKDLEIRLTNAKALSVLRDSIAEKNFSQFNTDIINDITIANIPKPFPFKISSLAIKEPIEQKFSQYEYIFINYTYKFYAFNKYAQAAIEGQKIPLEILEQEFDSAKATSIHNLKLFDDLKGNLTYLMKSDIPNKENPDNPLSLYFEFTNQQISLSKIYSELLLVTHFKNLENLEKYEYAVYKNGIKINGKGKIYEKYFQFEDNLPAPGSNVEIYRKGRSELIYVSPNNIITVIGRSLGGIVKPASLFSFLFLLLIAATLLLSLINTFIKAIPNVLDLSVFKQPSLRNRIQLYMIALIFFSFIVVGALTTIFFGNSFDSYHEGRLGRKTNTILKHTQKEIEHSFAQSGTQIDVKAISEIHRMDINVFDTKGRLQNSSDFDVFNKGIIAPYMDPIALEQLNHFGKSEIKIDQNIGDLKYKAAYVPLKTVDEKTFAYLGLPYYSEQGKLRQEVSDFMGFIINAYALLLLIAGGIAVYIANSITRPLDKIGSKLKQFKLGGRNEPLEWKNTNDEIGALIEEYNLLIKKLEDSAELLAQSERDAAWREMAKQVAHEIKNPLTPMKLSIQYLQHAYQSNPEDIEPLLKRVAGTLIEQIDNLAQIATEFSSFAKMPRAKNSKIILNKLVKSVCELFSKGEDSLDFQLQLPDEALCVFADKNQLMRVLNNLIKNAIQAVPDDRAGKINIHLYLKDTEAIIKVSDNGSGISEEMRDKVFVPNFTTKSSGTGIGLAISKNIIEAVNGQIYFETVVGKGTDFFVKLPTIEIEELEEV